MRDWHVFIWQSLDILNVLNTLTLKSIFFKTKIFLKKLGYRFLYESTRIENAIFPYKTAQSEANVKINRMGSTRWTNHKERNFASNYFIFSKILFQFKYFVQRVDLVYQPPKCPYLYFSKALEFYLRVLFPCEYPQGVTPFIYLKEGHKRNSDYFSFDTYATLQCKDNNFVFIG